MDILTFIVEIIKAIAWPVVTFIVIAIFYPQISALLRCLRIQRDENGRTLIDFKEEFKNAKVTIKELPKNKFILEDPKIYEIMQIMETNPQAGLLAAWINFETVAQERISKELKLSNIPFPIELVIKELYKEKIIKAEDAKFLEVIRKIRDQIVHVSPCGFDIETLLKATQVLVQLSLEIKEKSKKA